MHISAEGPSDRRYVRDLLAAAFDDPAVAELERALERRPDSFGFVARVDARIVGQVRLTRGWIDAERRLVEVLVLGPLSVLPEFQGQGIGSMLARHAVEQADSMGVPAVFLEGSPDFYMRLGWRPAAELGVTPPSVRIPPPAFQAVRFGPWEDWMRGALVYPEPFWALDCVGLRGERLRAARQRLGVPASDAAREASATPDPGG